MQRFTVACGIALAVTTILAASATAQTRVAVVLGVALPRPYLSGVIVVGPRYGYDAEPELVVVPVPRRYRYRHPYGRERREDHDYRHHRRHRGDWAYDDWDDE